VDDRKGFRVISWGDRFAVVVDQLGQTDPGRGRLAGFDRQLGDVDRLFVRVDPVDGYPVYPGYLVI